MAYNACIVSLLLLTSVIMSVSVMSCRRSRATNARSVAREPPKNESSARTNTGGLSDSKKQRLKSIFLDTINHWQYDEDAYTYNYTPEQRVKSGRGICWDYALYFYNECQKRGLSDVHFVVSNTLRHAWNEVWDGDTVYIIDATWADTNAREPIDDFFMINASYDEEHYAIDICVVDNTMVENDISSLYQGKMVDDVRRQKNTAARPIVKLKN